MRKSKNKPFFFLLKTELSQDAEGYLISPDQPDQCKVCLLAELTELLQESPTAEVIIGTPGSNALQVFVDAPKVSGVKLDKAIYWSIEPFLSTNIEDNQVFWRKAPTSERPTRTFIAAVSKQELSNWQQQLANANLPSAKIVLLNQAFACFDESPNSSIQWEDWVLWENEEGAGCLKYDLFLQAAQPKETSNIRDDFVNSATTSEKFELLRNALQKNLPEKTINFNAGHEKRRNWNDYFSWKPLIAASFMCCIFAAGYFLFMGKQFNERADEQMNASIAQYQVWFPNDQRIFDIQRQLQGKLRLGASANTGDGFITVIESTAKGIDENTNDYELQRLRFSGDDGSLEVVSVFENMDVVKSIEDSLKSSGLEMMVQSATRKSAGIEVGFTVEAERL